MNVLLSPAIFSVGYIYPNTFHILPILFSEKKKNIIVAGTFSKIIYSNQYFTMNGLYIHFELCSTGSIPDLGTKLGFDRFSGELSEYFHKENTQTPLDVVPYDMGTPHIDTPHSKQTIHYDPSIEHNRLQIASVCALERHLLQMYAMANDFYTHKKPLFHLKTQIQSGIIKTHHESSCIPETTLSVGRGTCSNRFGGEFAEELGRSNIPTYITKYIKISGIWETDQHYGITFKIMCR